MKLDPEALQAALDTAAVGVAHGTLPEGDGAVEMMAQLAYETWVEVECGFYTWESVDEQTRERWRKAVQDVTRKMLAIAGKG